MTQKLAVLFLTNTWRLVDQARFDRLARECRELADCFLTLDDRTTIDAGHMALGTTRTHVFNAAALPAILGFPYLTADGMVPGCVHYMLIAFAKQHQYEKYLIVENDVEFTGDWGEIANLCRNSDFDLLASYVSRYEEDPTWFWWDSLRDPEGKQPPRERLRKTFLPVSCYSRRAIFDVESKHRAGWSGHFEVLIPTLLTMDGMDAASIGRYGRFYLDPGEIVGTALTPSPHATLRWRPDVTLAEFTERFHPGIIYHPVKEDWAWVDGKLVRF